MGNSLRNIIFQQLSASQESLLQQRIRSQNPFAWGLQSLTFDERSLNSGTLNPIALSGFFSDGLAFDISATGNARIEPRPFVDSFASNQTTCSVFLGVANLSLTKPALARSEAETIGKRFSCVTVSINDQNTGEQPQTVEFAVVNLRLSVGDELRDGYETFKIAEIARNSQGGFVFIDTFVPPVVSIGVSTFIGAALRRLLAASVVRAHALSSGHFERASNAKSFSAAEATKYWLLNSLNESIVVLSHYSETGNCSPEHLYLELCKMIGRLAVFSKEIDVSNLPRFNFADLGSIFEQLFAKLISLVNSSLEENCAEIPVQRREDGMCLGKFASKEQMLDELYLAVEGTMTEADLRDRLPRFSKIASWAQISSILNSAVSGLPIEVAYQPPSALPRKPGRVFFQVSKLPEFWREVEKTGSIAMYHPLGLEAAHMTLYSVRKEGE